MAKNTDRDWRVTEGPAIGAEPEFEISDVQVEASFHGDGSMSRGIWATLKTSTPTQVESLGLTLRQLTGVLRILDTDPPLLPGLLRNLVELGPARGVLELASPDRYHVFLYLPPEQFAMLLPLFAPAPATGRLRIEVERLLHQAVDEPDDNFWNDHQSPAIVFNTFEITFPNGGSRADDGGRYRSPVSRSIGSTHG